MTKMEKLMVVVAVLGWAVSGYAKCKGSKKLEEVCGNYFEEEAKRVVARQRQKFYENATESNKT